MRQSASATLEKRETTTRKRAVKSRKKTAKKKRHFSQKERETMIVQYAYLVKYFAGRMAMRIPSHVVFEELVSAGCLGLIDAVDRFDPSKDVDLKTYASYRIKGAILDELRSMDWYSRSMRKKIQEIEKAVQSVGARVGRPPEDWEVAEEMGVALEEYFKMVSDIHGVSLLSLDEYIKGDDNDSITKKSFWDRVLSNENPADDFDKGELKQVVAEAIMALTEKERKVISLYYYDELTLKEIGQVLNLTESRICQIHTMTLIKLKAKLKGYHEK